MFLKLQWGPNISALFPLKSGIPILQNLSENALNYGPSLDRVASCKKELILELCIDLHASLHLLFGSLSFHSW